MKISTKALITSASVLVLTVIHHFYGAVIYDAPFRRHAAMGILPALLLLLLSYWIYLRYPVTISGRIARWIFGAVTLFISVGAIGFYEGGYNHLIKNILFFGGMSEANLLQLFPPPTYEMPNDFWFEATGILQFVIGFYAAWYFVKFWRVNHHSNPADTTRAMNKS